MADTSDHELDDDAAMAGAGAQLRAALRGAPGAHLPAELLRAASVDALPPEARADVDAHLRTCTVCRVLARDLADLDAAPAGGDVADSEAEVRNRVWARVTETRPDAGIRTRAAWWTGIAPVWLAAAAGLAVVALIQLRPGIAPAPRDLTSAIPTAAPPAATAAPSFRLPLDPPAVTLTSAALTLRAPGADSQAFLKALGPGLDAYRAGRYRDAAGLLATVSVDYPRTIEPAFYRGVSLLLAGEPAAAVPILEHADSLGSDALDDSARWFLAVARERAGDSAAAMADLARLCANGTGPTGSGYRAQACGAVK